MVTPFKYKTPVWFHFERFNTNTITFYSVKTETNTSWLKIEM